MEKDPVNSVKPVLTQKVITFNNLPFPITDNLNPAKSLTHILTENTYALLKRGDEKEVFVGGLSPCFFISFENKEANEALVVHFVTLNADETSFNSLKETATSSGYLKEGISVTVYGTGQKEMALIKAQMSSLKNIKNIFPNLVFKSFNDKTEACHSRNLLEYAEIFRCLSVSYPKNADGLKVEFTPPSLTLLPVLINKNQPQSLKQCLDAWLVTGFLLSKISFGQTVEAFNLSKKKEKLFKNDREQNFPKTLAECPKFVKKEEYTTYTEEDMKKVCDYVFKKN